MEEKFLNTAPEIDSDVTTIDITPTPSLEVLTVEIKVHLNQMGYHAIEAGKKLIQAKALVGHGNWADYLQNNFKLTQQSANRFMRVAERFGKLNIDVQFKSTQLIAMLALPAGEEEKFIAEKAAEGTPVEDMKVKALKIAILKYREELAKAKADMEESLTGLKAGYEIELSQKESQIELLNGVMKERQTQLDKVTGDNFRLETQLADKDKEIEELRNRPAEFEVPADYHDLQQRDKSQQTEIEKLKKENEELRNKPPQTVEPFDYQYFKKKVADIGDLDAEWTQLENEKAQFKADKKEFHKRVELKAVLEIFKTAYARFVVNLRDFHTPEVSKIRTESLPLFDEAFSKAMFWIENGVAPAQIDFWAKKNFFMKF